ncbi:MAG TPA: primosomal protein N', partial [Candidatus Hydrogenedentes bacterium]|nr:primosomal protein N' [Candidatus Hydrogenedentota bacterium]
VYLQVIEHALERGLGAIILVPEISLTPQTAARFYARFPGQIAVLHSGLGDGERFDEWRRVRQGQVRIVVGARSAVFAPVRRLGVIVVDEEHDNSYKQADTPRYHGRDVAVVRARLERAVCVLGSATPSLESMANTRNGKYTLLELTCRATGADLPTVRIIDTREETREIQGMLILSRELENAIRDRLDRKEQVILLLNRRGFAPYVLCPNCGWVAECAQCQVSLTYHSADASVKCHYCGEEKTVPQACEQCGFSPVLYMGLGTQRLEDYLARVFPGARIERMDADSTAGRGGHARILGRFAAGKIDILVGTQMLAKGHDFPGVTLVGVINADGSLAVPDFRAAEDTFQLLCQVAGRAGRGDRPGEVYIQTARPTHFAILHAARHDYPGFFEQEWARRQQAGFPPAARMA